MLSGFNTVGMHRIWFVPGLAVWGVPSAADIEFVAVEQVNSGKTVHFGSIAVGDASQHVLFSELTDHRGNQLPASIPSPRVLVRPHDGASAFVIGTETTASFQVARDPAGPGSVTADLLVIEMGD